MCVKCSINFICLYKGRGHVFKISFKLLKNFIAVLYGIVQNMVDIHIRSALFCKLFEDIYILDNIYKSLTFKGADFMGIFTKNIIN